MTEQLYFKVLGDAGQSYHGGTGAWSLPSQQEDGTWLPGKWMPPVKGAIEPCVRGYHLARRQDLIQWLGPRIFVAEVRPRGEVVDSGDKVVVRTARLVRECTAWTEQSVRLFACDCVDHMLDNLKRPPPDLDKMRDLLAVVRRYANGHATQNELAAAWAAARDAARDAAWDAAWDAARDAARAAAGDAARAAARAAARDAAWDAEREWQTARLMELLGEGVAI